MLTKLPTTVNKRISRVLSVFTIIFGMTLITPDVFQAASVVPRGSVPELTILVGVPENSQESRFFKLLESFINKFSTKAVSLKYVPGRGGADALNAFLGKPTDGRFIAGIQFPAFILQPMMPELRYRPDEISALAVLAKSPLALWVPEDSPWATVNDVVDAIRNRPSGWGYIAGVGSFTSHHMATFQFNRAAGIVMEYLPYIGSVEAVNAVLKGDAQACWGYLMPSETMHGLRPIAVASGRRSPLYPKVPTMEERDIDLVFEESIGLAVPVSIPEGTKKAIATAFVMAVMDKNFQSQAEKLGFKAEGVFYEEMEAFLAKQKMMVNNFLSNYPMSRRDS